MGWLIEAKARTLRKAKKELRSERCWSNKVSAVSFHVHSSGSESGRYAGSDGFNTVEEMVRSAKKLGIDTMVFMDHSSVGDKRLTARDFGEAKTLSDWAWKKHGVNAIFGVEYNSRDGHAFIVPSESSALEELPPEGLGAAELQKWVYDRRHKVHMGVSHPEAVKYGVSRETTERLMMNAQDKAMPFYVSIGSERDWSDLLPNKGAAKIKLARFWGATPFMDKYVIRLNEADAHRPHELTRIHFIRADPAERATMHDIYELMSRSQLAVVPEENPLGGMHSVHFDTESGNQAISRSPYPLFNVHFRIANIYYMFKDAYELLLANRF